MYREVEVMLTLMELELLPDEESVMEQTYLCGFTCLVTEK